MKDIKPINRHQPFPNVRGYNILLITHDGSYCSTQRWEGRKDAAQWILSEIQKGLDETNNWDRPVVRAFVNAMYSDGGNTTFEYDLTNISDLVLLGEAAEVKS